MPKVSKLTPLDRRLLRIAQTTASSKYTLSGRVRKKGAPKPVSLAPIKSSRDDSSAPKD